VLNRADTWATVPCRLTWSRAVDTESIFMPVVVSQARARSNWAWGTPKVAANCFGVRNWR